MYILSRPKPIRGDGRRLESCPMPVVASEFQILTRQCDSEVFSSLSRMTRPWHVTCLYPGAIHYVTRVIERVSKLHACLSRISLIPFDQSNYLHLVRVDAHFNNRIKSLRVRIIRNNMFCPFVREDFIKRNDRDGIIQKNSDKNSPCWPLLNIC